MKNVIFFKRKKFNFDDPRGYLYYCRGLREDERVLSRRQMEEGSEMIRCTIYFQG